jgi:hypothetical protein
VSDEIRLTLPRDRDFFRIAHLVVGGLAVRLDLTFEHLEDVQLALAGLLDEDDGGGGTVTVSVRLDGDRLTTRIGPVDGERLRGELAHSEEFGLGRVLATVADDVRIEGDEVELVKTVERGS